MQKFSPNRQVVLEIFKFQKSSDFIGREPFWLYITREPRFCQTCGFHQKIEHINAFRLNIIWTTSSWLVFLQKCKMSKTSFLGYFGPFLPNFGKMGVFTIYDNNERTHSLYPRLPRVCSLYESPR